MLRRIGVALLGLCVAFTFSVVSSGCGTVLGHAKPQPINVTIYDREKGAIAPGDKDVQVFLDGNPIGNGSGTYEVDPKAEGHKFTVRTTDKREGNGGVTRDLMAGVVIADAFMLVFPILIDYFNGGMYSWKSNLTINLGTVPEISGMPTDTGRPSNATTGTGTPATPTTVTCATCGEKRPANNEACPHCGVK